MKEKNYNYNEDLINRYKRATNQPVKSKVVVEENVYNGIKIKHVTRKKDPIVRFKRVAAGVLAALSVGATIYFVNRGINNNKEVPKESNAIVVTEEPQQNQTIADLTQTTIPEEKPTEKRPLIEDLANHISLKHFNGKASDPNEDYYCLDEDYALALSKEAIENVYENIKKVNPSSDLLKLLDSGIINEYLLTSISFVESNYRFQNSDHTLFANAKGGAFGMTQAQVPTIDTMNSAFGKYGVNFTKEDLANPQNALEFSTYDLLFNLSYYGIKSLDYTDENNIDTLRFYCAASYYHGGNGANKLLQQGVDALYESAYGNRVMNKYNSLYEQYADLEK
ncbi:MAG: hypothetical protein K6F08_00655 [bacterium]|nr:hypothetical protein [bacterium]